MLAGILERVDWANILYLGAHGITDPPKLVHIQRPWDGDAEPVRRQSTPEEIRAVFLGGGAVKVEKRKSEEVSS